MRCHFVKGFSLAEFHRLVSMAVLPVIYGFPWGSRGAKAVD